MSSTAFGLISLWGTIGLTIAGGYTWRAFERRWKEHRYGAAQTTGVHVGRSQQAPHQNHDVPARASTVTAKGPTGHARVATVADRAGGVSGGQR